MSQDELLQLIDQAATEGWTELDLTGRGLTELPPEIGKLTQLETLLLGKVEKWQYPGGKRTPQLATNAISKLPAEIAALQQLTALDLSGNPLGDLPEVVAQLTSLKDLRAIATNITTIPDSIAQLTNLTTLWLHSNQITTIPDSIAQLTNLT
ncbi:MAG: leucine-rich repeat domain-containing protein, partial [Synechococcales cyanobacterium K32_A2020_035]|nr:leucine-rich repeat domain-containing protein [Synechococcales cyanobacterium K32_A2020_035]